jgi:hypothetical protein
MPTPDEVFDNMLARRLERLKRLPAKPTVQSQQTKPAGQKQNNKKTSSSSLNDDDVWTKEYFVKFYGNRPLVPALRLLRRLTREGLRTGQFSADLEGAEIDPL